MAVANTKTQTYKKTRKTHIYERKKEKEGKKHNYRIYSHISRSRV